MDWKQEYKALCDFIAAHPEIVITANETSIPQAVRDDFYRRFDGFRKAVVESHYPSLPAGIEILSNNYRRTEKEVVELLALERIAMPTDLHSFLHNPKEGLTRALYNRTFDLLQGKTTLDRYEQQAAEEIRATAADLFRLGYEQWAALVWIKLLDPDRSYLVDIDDEDKPCLGELKDISFGRQAHHPTMRIPEFVLHSRKLDRYVAVKMMPAREIETFVVPFKPPVRPRKKTGDTSLVLDSRVMAFFFLPDPEKVPVVADIYDGNITSPDWMVEYVTGDELGDPEALAEVKRHHEVLRPRLGTCLTLMDDRGECAPQGIPEGMQLVAAGFDQSRLQSVIDSLTQNV